MLSVWSKVAQVRCRCNCPSCLPATNAITRRATTATARRTVRVGNVFTASLASLAVGLSFTESTKKDKRKKQWDNVIRETRATVEATEVEQQNRLAALSDGIRGEASKRTATVEHNISTGKAIGDVEACDIRQRVEQDKGTPVSENNWLDVFDWAREQQEIREASSALDLKGILSSLLQRPPEDKLVDLVSSEWEAEQYKYPISTKQVRTLEWSVAKLVLKLLMLCSMNAPQLGASPTCPTQYLLRELFDGQTIKTKFKHAKERLRLLHVGGMSAIYYQNFQPPPTPNYSHVSSVESEQTSELNLSLQEPLRLMNKDADMDEFIPKICSILLSARTPPNTHTYNMLLVGFCVSGKEDLVNAVLTSMRETHVRPDEVTHATLLRHFTVTGNRVGFRHYWKRMEGAKGGLGLIPHKKRVNLNNQERYLLFRQRDQKARMNGQVYEALIVGAMHFLGDQAAMFHYRRMIDEGWMPRPGIAIAILQRCCHRLDWVLGKATFAQLERTTKKIYIIIYEWMLRLCQCCGQQEVFDQILDQAVKRIRRNLDDGSFDDCVDEDARCHAIKWMDSTWKARVIIQNKLDIISASIQHTVLGATHALLALGHPLPRLEEELEKETKGVAPGKRLRHQIIHTIEERKFRTRFGIPGKVLDLPFTASLSENDAGNLFGLNIKNFQYPKVGPWNPLSSQLIREHPNKFYAASIPKNDAGDKSGPKIKKYQRQDLAQPYRLSSPPTKKRAIESSIEGDYIHQKFAKPTRRHRQRSPIDSIEGGYIHQIFAKPTHRRRQPPSIDSIEGGYIHQENAKPIRRRRQGPSIDSIEGGYMNPMFKKSITDRRRRRRHRPLIDFIKGGYVRQILPTRRRRRRRHQRPPIDSIKRGYIHQVLANPTRRRRRRHRSRPLWTDRTHQLQIAASLSRKEVRYSFASDIVQKYENQDPA